MSLSEKFKNNAHVDLIGLEGPYNYEDRDYRLTEFQFFLTPEGYPGGFAVKINHLDKPVDPHWRWFPADIIAGEEQPPEWDIEDGLIAYRHGKRFVIGQDWHDWSQSGWLEAGVAHETYKAIESGVLILEAYYDILSELGQWPKGVWGFS